MVCAHVWCSSAPSPPHRGIMFNVYCKSISILHAISCVIRRLACSLNKDVNLFVLAGAKAPALRSVSELAYPFEGDFPVAAPIS